MRGSGPKREREGRRAPDPSHEWAIARHARPQHGVVSLAQLRDAGLTAGAVRKRAAAGRLRRVHTGVYATGHARLTPAAHRMAAVLACGEGAGLSHRASAANRGLHASSKSTIDVISPRRAGRRRTGIHAHTSSTLLPRDISDVDGIPCTSVARTLLDLAATEPRRVVERAFDQAEVLEVLDAREIEDVLARTNGHPGAGVLRAILDDHRRTPALTRNELEDRFLAICRSAGVPVPEVNAWIGLEPTGYEPDFLWRRERLVAESDGRETHLTRRAFERDRRRDQRLMLAGWRVVRFTWDQVVDEPAVVAATLRGLLSESGNRLDSPR